MAKNSSEESVMRKISFEIPEENYANLALLTASRKGAPTPGPFMRDLALEISKKGGELRAKLVSKKG